MPATLQRCPQSRVLLKERAACLHSSEQLVNIFNGRCVCSLWNTTWAATRQHCTGIGDHCCFHSSVRTMTTVNHIQINASYYRRREFQEFQTRKCTFTICTIFSAPKDGNTSAVSWLILYSCICVVMNHKQWENSTELWTEFAWGHSWCENICLKKKKNIQLQSCSHAPTWLVTSYTLSVCVFAAAKSVWRLKSEQKQLRAII